jgi:ribonuclease P protein component
VRVHGPGIVVHAKPSAIAGARVALSIGRNVGGSVERHRLARQLREAARSVAAGAVAGVDIVIRALPSAAGRGGTAFQDDVRSSLREALRQAARGA